MSIQLDDMLLQQQDFGCELLSLDEPDATAAAKGVVSTKQVMKLKCVECPQLLPDGYDGDVVQHISHVSEFFFFSNESDTSDASDEGGHSKQKELLDSKLYWDDSLAHETANDSGLSSDPEGFTPPPLPRRVVNSPCNEDDSGSDVSVDSLVNDTESSAESSGSSFFSCREQLTPPIPASPIKTLPSNLLEEIRLLGQKQSQKRNNSIPASLQFKEMAKSLDSKSIRISAAHPRCNSLQGTRALSLVIAENDSGSDSSSLEENHRFHLHENKVNEDLAAVDDLSFVGIKDILSIDSGDTIRSNKGTVRGVRNRVRNGITTYLQGKTSKVSGQFLALFLVQ